MKLRLELHQSNYRTRVLTGGVPLSLNKEELVAEEPKSHRAGCPCSKNKPSILVPFWNSTVISKYLDSLHMTSSLPMPAGGERPAVAARQGKMEGLSVYFDECKWILLLVKTLSRPWWNEHTPPLPIQGEQRVKAGGEKCSRQIALIWNENKQLSGGGSFHYFRDLGILAYTFMN